MNTLSSIDVALTKHALQAAQANRIGWMVDELDRSGTGATPSPTWRLAARVAGAATALLGLMLALPWR